jgi:hypothetical protein
MLDYLNPSDWDDPPEIKIMQITVAFVNHPNKNPKFGSIKGEDGRYYDVDAHMVSKYRKGMTFDAPVKEREYGGKTYYSIPSSFDPTGGQPPVSVATTAENIRNGYASAAPPRPAVNGSTHSTPRQMFIMGVVGRAMGSGTFQPDAIELLTQKAGEAWDLHG